MSQHLERAKEALRIAEAVDSKRTAYMVAADEIAAHIEETGDDQQTVANLLQQTTSRVSKLVTWRKRGYDTESPYDEGPEKRQQGRARVSHAKRALRDPIERKSVFDSLTSDERAEVVADVVKDDEEVIDRVLASPKAAKLRKAAEDEDIRRARAQMEAAQERALQTRRPTPLSQFFWKIITKMHDWRRSLALIGEEMDTLDSGQVPEVLRAHNELAAQIQMNIDRLEGKAPPEDIEGSVNSTKLLDEKGAMGDQTAIAWTDATFNPWMGCHKVSAGCKHCYAEALTTKRMGLDVWGLHGNRRRTGPAVWAKPHRWNRAAQSDRLKQRVFCASLADVFEDEPGPNAWRSDVFELIRETRWLDWQLLTKRPENLERMLPDDWGDGWENVWLGTSIENNEVAHRAKELTSVPSVVHFVSYEPAIGPLDELDLTDLEWMIVGGESGPGFRPLDLDWARDMRRRCDEAGIAFFFKQNAAPRTEMGIDALGGVVRAWPRDRERHDRLF